MTTLSTLKCGLPAAEICRRNGWDKGTMLWGEPTPKDAQQRRAYLEITGVCAGVVVGIERDADGRRLSDEHIVVEFTTREWHEIKGRVPPEPTPPAPARRGIEGQRHVREED